jgi:WD40 repeat protein
MTQPSQSLGWLPIIAGAAFCLFAQSSSAQEPKERSTLKGHTGHVDNLVFSADSKMLVSGSHDTTLRLWDVATGKELARFKHADVIWSVAITSDGNTLASGSDDGTITIWDVATGKRQASFKGKENMIRSLAFSPDGKTLFSGAEGGAIKAWDVATAKQRVALAGGERPTLLVSPDGKVLVSGSVDEIRAWDTATFKERFMLKGGDRHTGFTAVAMSSDGTTLASVGVPGTIKLWEVATGKARATTLTDRPLCSALAFSGDGKFLASARRGSLKIWDVATGKERATISVDKGDVMAFSPDCNTLASVSRDGVIKLWDVPQPSR